MGPCPLPGGRLMFTSNRNAFRPPKHHGGTMQLFVMDEDGSNLEEIGYLNIGMALHPTVLRDGRVMFSSLEAQGLRNNILWGLWVINPDGTSWNLATINANAWYRGTSGNDTISGSTWNDTIAGGAGNDTMLGSVSPTATDGIDRVTYTSNTASQSVTVLLGGTGSDGCTARRRVRTADQSLCLQLRTIRFRRRAADHARRPPRRLSACAVTPRPLRRPATLHEA